MPAKTIDMASSPDLNLIACDRTRHVLEGSGRPLAAPRPATRAKPATRPRGGPAGS